jgi:2-isopropylmalate synthase
MAELNITPQIEILDTTLRDGAQGEGISFSLQDKIAVVKALDQLGVSFIEAGNPGSNPKDMEFFKEASRLELEHAKLCAFGATRRKGTIPSQDEAIQSLLAAHTDTVVIFGKSWDLHVVHVLRVSHEENLAMIAETISFFKEKGKTVIYDAEHFFDGYRANKEYAMATAQTALSAGADSIVLCDTNGGSFPDRIEEGVRAVLELGNVNVGIHAHNDAGMAVANSIMAVKAGARHVQGTLVGFGERCGNAALAAVIPNIELKLQLQCLPKGKLENITETARLVAEIANVPMPDDMPYVGLRAFAHKAGMHADGILKTRTSFEHIDPALVGNWRRFLMSEMGGRAAIAERIKKLDPSVSKEHPVTAALAAKLKSLEAEGWQFEGADASFELLARRELGKYKPLFSIERYEVQSTHPSEEGNICSTAWVKVKVGHSTEIAASEGNGPVNALDSALRQALKRFYPELSKVRLTDYKVRVIDSRSATGARVRVLIESTDGQHAWTTIGVSTDIIEASSRALADSIEFSLIQAAETKNSQRGE